MLPVLKKAGVVDAGGRGLLIIFTGFYKAIINDESVKLEFVDAAMAYEKDKEFHANLMDLAEIEFGYCTEFMIINMYKKTTQSDIDKLRDRLCDLGDSVICIGDLSLVKVHVHTNEPNRALGYALELGELWNVKIENMLEQNRQLKKEVANKEPEKEMGMVAVAAGEGLSLLFKDLMVDNIIKGGQTMNPSANDIAEAVNKVNARNVFVFPNNKNIILAAEQAKDLTDKKIFVIPTKSIPEGVASCLAFNEEYDVKQNEEAMIEAIKDVKSGSVTYAVRDTHIDGFDLTIGEIIGLDNNTILSKGDHISTTTETLVEKLIDENSANITLFYGEGVSQDDALALQETLQNKYPNCEVSALAGGQPVYYYLVSII